jgi:hypothetical protein
MVDKDHADRPATHRDLQKRPESTRINYLCYLGYPSTLSIAFRVRESVLRASPHAPAAE